MKKEKKNGTIVNNLKDPQMRQLKKVNRPLTDNFKSRDASASKKQIDNPIKKKVLGDPSIMLTTY